MKKQYPLYNIAEFHTLRALLQMQSDTIPDSAAFSFFDETKELNYKTYRQFYNDVNALGTLEFSWCWNARKVGIVGENSYEWLVVFCSLTGGGNVAVPFDKELSENDLQKIIVRSNVETLFVSAKYMEKIRKIWSGEIIALEDIIRLVEEGERLFSKGYVAYREYDLQPREVCCIMFTSGTSGGSKGVMLSNENFASDIIGSCALFVLEGNTISVLPYHHAFGLNVSVFMSFYWGRTVHINRNLKMFLTDMEKTAPQTLYLVPAFVENFSRQIWGNARKSGKEQQLRLLMKVSDALRTVGIDCRKMFFKTILQVFGGNIQYIICGGAMLEEKYVREYRSWGIEILNGYGTTECSPCVAVNRNYLHKDGTVGLPLPGLAVRIAQDGEVEVFGQNVMLGYYNDEEATREVLKEGWYSTGDLGFLDKDGFLTLTGRKKNLIILSNGENISPEQLEGKLLECPAVCEAMVYEKNREIVAEIFPVEEYLGREDYFGALIKKINRSEPISRRIRKVKLRECEFEKNTSKKIIRNQ